MLITRVTASLVENCIVAIPQLAAETYIPRSHDVY